MICLSGIKWFVTKRVLARAKEWKVALIFIFPFFYIKKMEMENRNKFLMVAHADDGLSTVFRKVAKFTEGLEIEY